jgi:hypothetical protein
MLARVGASRACPRPGGAPAALGGVEDGLEPEDEPPLVNHRGGRAREGLRGLVLADEGGEVRS